MPENTIDGPRIVLVGAAGAGKSSLLGALAQAAQTHEQVLGHLTDISGGLEELKQRTYDNKPSATQEETVPYPVAWGGEETVPAMLIDSAGRVAGEYLAGDRSLDDGGPVSLAIKQADALVLAVAPAEPAQLEESFKQCTEFLRLIEQQRGRRSEIAGLPVFLLLTKCDLLARKDDGAGAWLARIEDAKRKIGKRFEQFIEQNKGIPFGTIDLRLGAVAIKQPALTDRPARLREPFGVAELFRGILASARAFHEQRSRAHRRLHMAVMGLVGLITIMGLLAAGFFLTRPSAEVAALENAIRTVLPAPTAPAAELLREPLAPKFKELVRIQESPDFTRLPEPMREEVRRAVQEMTIYQELGKKLDGLKRVRFFKKEEEIETFSHEVDRIVLPPAYLSQWTDTRLARKIQQYKSELAALARALADEKAWLKQQIEEGDNLRKMAIAGEGSPERRTWIARADAFLKRKDLMKEVPNVANMRFRDLYEFPSVSSLRDDFETVRARVDKIRGGLINS